METAALMHLALTQATVLDVSVRDFALRQLKIKGKFLYTNSSDPYTENVT